MTLIRLFLCGFVTLASLEGHSKDGSADKSTEETVVHRDRTGQRDPKGKRERREERAQGYIFDEPIFSTAPSKKTETSGIGVNTYLWKASLEAISFMPKKSADPFGGVIITEWYTMPEVPTERLRVEVLILGRTLRSDAVKVSVFRQIQKGPKKEWVDAAVAPETVQDFEETILMRAREMKVAEEKR